MVPITATFIASVAKYCNSTPFQSITRHVQGQDIGSRGSDFRAFEILPQLVDDDSEPQRFVDRTQPQHVPMQDDIQQFGAGIRQTLPARVLLVPVRGLASVQYSMSPMIRDAEPVQGNS